MGTHALKIAYLIMVHKNMAQFERLFRVIYNPSDCYLVHVDKKSDAAYHRAVRDLVRDYPNARKLEDSVKVQWGGWTLTELILRGIEHLLRQADDWDYLVNLSGQDFPLKSTSEVRAFLAEQPGWNHISASDPAKGWPAALSRTRYYWFSVPCLPIHRPIRVPLIKRRFLANAKPYIGSSWFELTRAFCEWLVSSPDVERFKRFYKHTVCSDEGFVQTVIMHSPFQDTVVNDNQRLIIWAGKSNPEILTWADRERLLSCGKLYARKFDPAVDGRILDDLEARVCGPTGDPPG